VAQELVDQVLLEGPVVAISAARLASKRAKR
jgi:hypothetical protein